MKEKDFDCKGSTCHSGGTVNGISILAPNVVKRGSEENITIGNRVYKGFYISYNNHDIALYGSDTTALVLGQTQLCLILNGDHRKEYASLIEKGFNACSEYFFEHKEEWNEYSEHETFLKQRTSVANPNNKKKLNVLVQCMAVYNSSLMVPEHLSLEEAIEYAKEHLCEIQTGELQFISDSEVVDEENCKFEENECEQD